MCIISCELFISILTAASQHFWTIARLWSGSTQIPQTEHTEHTDGIAVSVPRYCTALQNISVVAGALEMLLNDQMVGAAPLLINAFLCWTVWKQC